MPAFAMTLLFTTYFIFSIFLAPFDENKTYCENTYFPRINKTYFPNSDHSILSLHRRQRPRMGIAAIFSVNFDFGLCLNANAF